MLNLSSLAYGSSRRLKTKVGAATLQNFYPTSSVLSADLLATSKLRGFMFGLLRLIRAMCGFVFAIQVIHVIEAVAWLSKPEAIGVDMGKFFALLLFKVIFLVAAGLLFFWLRGLINLLHTKKNGRPHPALADKKWAI